LQPTWWHIAEVAAFQHFINASNDCKNTQIFIPRGKAAILAICSLSAGDFYAIKNLSFSVLFSAKQRHALRAGAFFAVVD